MIDATSAAIGHLADFDRMLLVARVECARHLCRGRTDPRRLGLLNRLDRNPVEQTAGDLGGRYLDRLIRDQRASQRVAKIVVVGASLLFPCWY